MLNLNRNTAYKSFQEQRYSQKEKNNKISGLALSKTMINYSGIANKYLTILSQVIIGNNLEEFDYRYFAKNKDINKATVVLTAAL